ncbi:uncharacterized protein LOC131243266 [Magnolia sinica]|uniref:uncharacterized protein LOC131243266 n=1 Tax=Magnolia sinica TaxID=86752 RepID=UPI0026594E59|nr:uncharacterized protein LOC131243266 [Magnolia sinica]
MSMLDSFFKKGFNGPKCKTLLKLTIPRIKLLRNRREIQLKQMRRDIAKLLETGQEATARIRVEHIIREENMMAAQEIIELFCELISVRLPIIETQRECPLDLKEAISSICFAAPRCSDLPELQQVQMLFASKYGKEFVAAATELMPDCGVNRQMIELLSVRAPSVEVKLKLLKEIAEEHELDWDPAATESEFTKPHEDLLNGPTQFISGSKLPLPKEKHDGPLSSTHIQAPSDQSDLDPSLDSLDLPEVPKVLLQPGPTTVTAPEMASFHPSSADLGSDSEVTKSTHQPGPATVSAPEMVSSHPAASSDSASDDEVAKSTRAKEDVLPEYCWEPDTIEPEKSFTSPYVPPDTSTSITEEKQFLPFVSSPSLSSASFSERRSEPARALSRAKSEINVDMQDVLAAAHAAAETAERAAAAARSVASLAQVRITELLNRRNGSVSENKNNISTFPVDGPDRPSVTVTPAFDGQQSFAGKVAASHSWDSHPDQGSGHMSDTPKTEPEAPDSKEQVLKHQSAHQPLRSTSLEDDPYFSYPNLFTPPDSNLRSGTYSPVDNSRSDHRSE